MDPKDYKGEEWTDLLKQFNTRQMRNALKTAYRRVSKKAIEPAKQELRSSGLNVRGSKADWEKGIRAYIYSKGGGFLLTVNARRANKSGKGEKGMHVNRYGKAKPILMWAEDGTEPRQRGGAVSYKTTGNEKWAARHGGLYRLRRKRVRTGGKRSGKMPKYGFLEKAEPKAYRIVETELSKDVEAAVAKAAHKAGFI